MAPTHTQAQPNTPKHTQAEGSLENRSRRQHQDQQQPPPPDVGNTMKGNDGTALGTSGTPIDAEAIAAAERERYIRPCFVTRDVYAISTPLTRRLHADYTPI